MTAEDIIKELQTWPDKFRQEAAELRVLSIPNASGGAIVYEDIARHIETLLKRHAPKNSTRD